MGVHARVRVGEGEDLASALRRFQQRVQLALQRPWCKPRLGHHEKPGVLRRRKRLVQQASTRVGGQLKFVWWWPALWIKTAVRSFGRSMPRGSRARRRNAAEAQELRGQWLCALSERREARRECLP